MNGAKWRSGSTVGLLSVLLLIVGGLGYWVSAGARGEATRFREDTLRKLQYSAQLNAYQAEGYARALRVIESDDPSRRKEYRDEGHTYRLRVDEILKSYDAAIPKEAVEERRAFEKFVETRKQYRAVASHLVELSTNGQAAVARQMIDTDMAPAYGDYAKAGDALYQFEIAAGNQHALNLDRTCARAQYLTAFICVGVFLAGFLLLFVVYVFSYAGRPAPVMH